MLKRTPLTYLLNENVEEHITRSHLMYRRNINQCIVAADTHNKTADINQYSLKLVLNT